ncbi:type I-U CRISPR-associated protein Csb2 [uncultured Desulfuromonas sp.]|uniref:type I-G CRISPR-associated protein Csb2 n=1 Tax=uncultured Desulfuromonas sp. TaxID=181013 RepID=UPI002AAA8559|nr:type I-U CRISPR-associated protein Csb2 [uncultured Desulfuromonas sp.]
MKLGIEIGFLVTPQLSDPSSPRQGEWPPAPDRIFQALVATAAETGQDMQVLAHLESAPEVQASNAQRPLAPTGYVPANFKKNKRYHPNTARHLPVVLPENPVVTYVWDNVPEDVVPAISSIVERVTHIGRASSLVRSTIKDGNAVRTNWIPNEVGHKFMRAPYPGRLNDLQTTFGAGLRSHPAPAYGYLSTTEKIISTPWGDLMVLKTCQQLDLTSATKWAGNLRRAMMSVAADDIPSLIHGHDNHRHVAWAAIPDVGHKYASGNILGLGCWLPADITTEEKGYIGSLLIRVSNLNGVRLQIDSVGLKGLRATTWSRASRKWATVTPIALDRWPKRNKRPEQIITDSLVAMGLPVPSKISCSNYSPVRGAANPRKYPARNGNRFITHAEIEWDKLVAGPLLIGADRYFAGGLCLAMDRRN